jgi:hypothetical protein
MAQMEMEEAAMTCQNQQQITKIAPPLALVVALALMGVATASPAAAQPWMTNASFLRPRLVRHLLLKMA